MGRKSLKCVFTSAISHPSFHTGPMVLQAYLKRRGLLVGNCWNLVAHHHHCHYNLDLHCFPSLDQEQHPQLGHHHQDLQIYPLALQLSLHVFS